MQLYPISLENFPISPHSKKLLDQLRDQIQLKHYSPRSEEVYVRWVREFILFHKGKSGSFRHPGEMGMFEVHPFLTHLAVDRKVAASTQNQAISSIIFLLDSRDFAKVGESADYAKYCLTDMRVI